MKSADGRIFPQNAFIQRYFAISYRKLPSLFFFRPLMRLYRTKISDKSSTGYFNLGDFDLGGE